jgi:hypothetical protein
MLALNEEYAFYIATLISRLISLMSLAVLMFAAKQRKTVAAVP